MGTIVDFAAVRADRAARLAADKTRWRVRGDRRTAHRRAPGGLVALCGAGSIESLAHPSFRRCEVCWPQEAR
jgi:hypothetical protein